MQPWTVRTVVRAVVSAAIAGLAVASTIWVDNPYIKIASATLGALAAYFTVGAASSTVEPFFGPNKNNDTVTPVPSPPAVPVSEG